MEDGVVTVSDRGTGQGSVISPLLANIYLHYVLDLWAVRWRQRVATGDMIIVRYADDFIVGFQHESDAQRFLDEMRERLGKFALTLHPEKTRLIEFGRFAAERRQRRGLGKPETFNFLGFTFICGKTRPGKFQLQRKTRRDRMRAKLKMIKAEMCPKFVSECAARAYELRYRDIGLECAEPIMNRALSYPVPDETCRLADGRLARAAIRKWHDVRLRSTHGILIALDMESLDQMRRVVEQTTAIEGIVGYKVGLTATLRLGLGGAVAHLRFVDRFAAHLRSSKGGSGCARHGAEIFRHVQGGRRRWIDFVSHRGSSRRRRVCRKRLCSNRLLPIVGGDLPFPDYNASGGGYVVDDALDRIFRKAIEIGVDHFVIPGNTAAKVAHHAGWLVEKIERPALFIPGIGALGGSIAATFSAAPGCDLYAVVGRAIYDAADPAEAARRLAGEALRFV